MFEGYDNQLVVWLAPRYARAAVRVVLALHDRLAQIITTSREPLLGQIKLAWWRDQLVALDSGAVPPEPLLRAVAGIIGDALTGALLSGLADEEERPETLHKALALLCGAQSKSQRLLDKLALHDHSRTLAGRPLASPAHRTLMALQMHLLGR